MVRPLKGCNVGDTFSYETQWIVSDVTKQGYPLDYWNVTRDGTSAGTLERETTATGKHSCSSLLVLRCLCLATNQNDFAWLQDRVLAYGPVHLLVYSMCVS
jgi:hypothetical protein